MLAHAEGIGQSREEALENLVHGLAGLALHESMRRLGWRLVETYDPIDFPDELTFPVELGPWSGWDLGRRGTR